MGVFFWMDAELVKYAPSINKYAESPAVHLYIGYVKKTDLTFLKQHLKKLIDSHTNTHWGTHL